MKTRLLLADDHKIVREALEMILNGADDVEVVGMAEDGHQAIAMAKKLTPDVILLDLMMPVMDGKAALRELGRALPKARILVLSSYADERQARECVARRRGRLPRQANCGFGASARYSRDSARKRLFQPIYRALHGSTRQKLRRTRPPEIN